MRNLYAKISQDMADSQFENGLVPDVCPGYVGEAFAQWYSGYLDSPEWGFACIINPWYVYRFYGDASLLKRHYSSMKRYMMYLAGKAHRGILRHGLGDWLDIGVQKPYSQNTPVQVVATNIYYYALTLMEQAAVLLKQHEDAGMYRRLMAQTYAEYNALFFDDQTNRYATGSQTAQAMSLISGLFLRDREQQILDQLVRDIKLRNYAVTCGDIGHPFVVAALTKYGQSDVLYAMTTATDQPGYGYQVKSGATALTEEWDGPAPGNPHGSQNHLMLGSIEEWFFCGLAGLQSIRSELPFGQLLIKLHFPPDLSALDAHITHPYGKVSVSWRRENAVIRLELSIPANLTARFVNAFSGEEQTLGSGTHAFQLKAL